ncbi:hypothetical protein COO60DRAFT_231640 [Scenedesmus sp. NREL 46B-D3]|nr:hypothetical protein COO60DRAFT_231640 [Scenedesmus sp. NREL 46B-D3]
MPSQRPLLFCLASNVTLFPKAWGAAWPAAGVTIRRHLLLLGSSIRRPSIDLGMQVRQMVLVGPSSNVTLFNVALENLAYGDEGSGKNAEGTSIVMPSQLWAFDYRRVFPRLVLWDCTLVMPEQRYVESLVYWASAFNSELDYWSSQTVYMRESLRVTDIQISSVSPGLYAITALHKKDMFVVNTTLTTRPVAAPPLPLPFNASIHQNLVAGQADPAVGPMYSVEDLAVTLFNIHKGGCGRSFVLLPSSPSGLVSWGAVSALNYSRITGGRPPDMVLPSLDANASSAEAEAAAAALKGPPAGGDTPLPLSWPVQGGWLVRCPMQFQGTRVLDVGFEPGMFRLQDPSDPKPGPGPDSQAGPDNPGLGSGTGSRVLFHFVQMGFRALPQGDLLAAAGSGSTGSWQLPQAAAVPTGDVAAGSMGGSSWMSKLPAEAYTHLLWFISRNVAVGDQVSLSNVTLILPPQEAAQLAAAASAALQAAAGTAEQAVLSMVYPTPAGPFPVVYRSLIVADSTSVAGEHGAAAADVRRRLLSGASRDDSRQQTICVGSLEALA